MYICICKAVTENDVRHAMENGAATVRNLHDELGVASCCGKCAPAAKMLVKEIRFAGKATSTAFAEAA